jgi:hypothetical protein
VPTIKIYKKKRLRSKEITLYFKERNYYNQSVEPLNGAHGGLDVEGAHVLPMLLQQRHQEVHGQMHVLDLAN